MLQKVLRSDLIVEPFLGRECFLKGCQNQKTWDFSFQLLSHLQYSFIVMSMYYFMIKLSHFHGVIETHFYSVLCNPEVHLDTYHQLNFHKLEKV